MVVVQVVGEEAAAALDLIAARTVAHRHRRDRDPVGAEVPSVGEVDVAPRDRRPRLPVPPAHVRADVLPVALAGGPRGNGEGGRRGGSTGGARR